MAPVEGVDSGSFRDREGRVFYHRGEVLRALSATALDAWNGLHKKKFFRRLLDDGKVVATEQVDLPQDALAHLHEGADHWRGCLRHERIPFVTYPYEWSFSMLRDAADLQLELVQRALRGGYTMKDATSYNVQFVGARPVFIDVASFEPWAEGDPWVGYSQFCQLFLYPLMFTAYRDLPFQPWLRGAVDGIEPEAAAAVLGRWHDLFRPGVLKDTWIMSRLKKGNQGSDARVRDDLRRAGFKKEMIQANLGRLRKIVGGLRWGQTASEWADYAEDNSYDAAGRAAKEAFVRRAAERRASEGGAAMAWDLGANTGHYSRLIADLFDQVVSMDGDPLAVDRQYRRLRGGLADGGSANVLPLVMNLSDPSPALGWNHAERKSLAQRATPDLVLALALVHHMVISANVPLPEFVAWLASLTERSGGNLVIEFVTKDDPMVKRLLRNKPDIYHDYELPVFEECLARHFRIAARQDLLGGRRVIFEGVRQGAPRTVS